MARTRTYDGNEGVRIACSICGNSFSYPSEIRYRSDRTFRCLTYCDDPHLPSEEDKKHGQSLKSPDAIAPRFNVGVKPSWE